MFKVKFTDNTLLVQKNIEHPLWKIVSQLFYKVKLAIISQQSYIWLLALEKWNKIHSHKNLIRMFIVVLLRVTKNSKQLKCISTGKWVNKLWNLCIMKHHTSQLKGMSLINTLTWMNFKSTISQQRAGLR
jgi:hypothetical protein